MTCEQCGREERAFSQQKGARVVLIHPADTTSIVCSWCMLVGSLKGDRDGREEDMSVVQGSVTDEHGQAGSG